MRDYSVPPTTERKNRQDQACPQAIEPPSISCKAFLHHDAGIPHGGIFHTEENSIFKQTPYGNWKHGRLEDALEKIEQIKKSPFRDS